MKEAIQGSDKILAVRLLKNINQKDGIKLALQTSHTYTVSNDNSTEQTKDGPVAVKGATSYELSIEYVASRDELNLELYEASKNNEQVEFWIIDRNDKTEDGKYKAIYLRGLLDSWEEPSEVSSLVTHSTDVSVIGIPQEGTVTLTDSQENQVFYAFHDLEKVTEENPEEV